MAIPAHVWQHVYSWYSADFAIARFIKRDATNKKSYYLDLYPEHKKNPLGNRESDIYSEDSEPEPMVVKEIDGGFPLNQGIRMKAYVPSANCPV